MAAEMSISAPVYPTRPFEPAGLEQLKPAAFMGLETSPGNYQAWVALPARQADKDFARRLRKGAGADDTASGATRVAGHDGESEPTRKHGAGGPAGETRSVLPQPLEPTIVAKGSEVLRPRLLRTEHNDIRSRYR